MAEVVKEMTNVAKWLTQGGAGTLGKKAFKAVEPGIGNLGLGVTTTALAGATAFVGVGATKAAGTWWDSRIKETTGMPTYVGNMPDYAYDGAGQVDRRTGDKSLGATGDLVFGLNAGRHGGR